MVQPPTKRARIAKRRLSHLNTKEEFLTAEDLQKLKDLAEKYTRDRPTTPCEMLWRSKPTAYFDDIMNNSCGIMRTYRKDYNGDQKSAINGNINGLFFSANNGPSSTNKIPDFSPFGDVRLCIPVDFLLTGDMNLYFADFYCTRENKPHYITLVITKMNSFEDTFCQEHLLALNWYDNPFFSIVSDSANTFNVCGGVWMELFYTENVNIYEALALGGTLDNIIGRGTSCTDGLMKNFLCTICNLPTPPGSSIIPDMHPLKWEVDTKSTYNFDSSKIKEKSSTTSDTFVFGSDECENPRSQPLYLDFQNGWTPTKTITDHDLISDNIPQNDGSSLDEKIDRNSSSSKSNDVNSANPFSITSKNVHPKSKAKREKYNNKKFKTQGFMTSSYKLGYNHPSSSPLMNLPMSTQMLGRYGNNYLCRGYYGVSNFGYGSGRYHESYDSYYNGVSNNYNDCYKDNSGVGNSYNNCYSGNSGVGNSYNNCYSGNSGVGNSYNNCYSDDIGVNNSCINKYSEHSNAGMRRRYNSENWSMYNEHCGQYSNSYCGNYIPKNDTSYSQWNSSHSYNTRYLDKSYDNNHGFNNSYMHRQPVQNYHQNGNRLGVLHRAVNVAMGAIFGKLAGN